jgi:hypothetical protein
MTTIKFPRPDGEARLEIPFKGAGPDGVARLSWVPTISPECQPDGGLVSIDIGQPCRFALCCSSDHENLRAKLANHCADPEAILAAAEKLRNERRRLAEDGSEWRCVVGPGTRVRIATFSAPTLTGLTLGWDDLPDGATFVTLDESDGWPWDHDLRAAVLIWHRAAYVLQPDECSPPGELPRKMAEDEVRDREGRVLKMRMGTDSLKRPLVLIGDDMRWHPARPLELPTPCPFDPSQLARLQAFWERSQPKEAELKWKGDWVIWTDHSGARCYSGHWSDRALNPESGSFVSPAQRATVEAFFAAGPPGEEGCKCGKCPGYIFDPGGNVIGQTQPSEPARVTDVRFKHHDLKCWPVPFAAIASGRKTFEWRKDDRNFQEGDAVILREWRPETGSYTGARIECSISYVLRGAFGVPDGFCIFNLEKPAPEQAAALSDHIRRGEGNSLAAGYRWMRKRCGHVSDTPQRVCPECGDDDGTTMPIKESAPDLTELREALKVWNDEGTWTASERLAAAVERLVGK